jgi:hypothetical protein
VGDAIQLHQRQLDALVARDVVLFARSEVRGEQIRHSRRHREQPFLARRRVVGHGRFEQVSGAEVLVEEREILEAQVGHIDLDERIQIPVRLLRRRNAGDDAVDLRVQRRIGLDGERPGRPFDPFVDIRIGPERPAELPGRLAGSDVKIAQVAGGFELLLHVLEGLGAIHFLPRRPEGIVQRDRRHRQRRQTLGGRQEIGRVICRGRVRAQDQRQPESHQRAGHDANRGHIERLAVKKE